MVGDLTPIYDDDTGYALYGDEYAKRPSLFEGEKSVSARSMAVYKNPDIFYTGMLEHGPIIACCNVHVFRVLIRCEGDCADDRFLQDEDDEGVEVLTQEDYRELFGEDFDPAAWEEDAIAFGQD